jgi:hypothetical protein
MTMANLIKRIAVSTSKRTGSLSMIREFTSSSGGPKSTSGHHTSSISAHARRTSFIELSANVFHRSRGDRTNGRTGSFKPTGNQIKKTEEIFVRSEHIGGYNSDVGVEGWKIVKGDNENIDDEPWMTGKGRRLVVTSTEIGAAQSVDDVTEGAESVRSDDGQKREESEDEVVLVRQE